jgi:hypothetical protein
VNLESTSTQFLAPADRGSAFHAGSAHPLRQLVGIRHGSRRRHGFQCRLQADALGSCLIALGFEHRPVLGGFELNHHVQSPLLARNQLGDLFLDQDSLTRFLRVQGENQIVLSHKLLLQFYWI